VLRSEQQKEVRLMPRDVKEWVGKTDDTPPPPRVKERILRAHGNRCAITGQDIRPGDPVEFDHIIALANGGANTESNLQPVIASAHKAKSREDMRVKAKSSRVFKKHMGIAGKRRPIPYRRFDETPVWPKQPIPKGT
jgi:5-methylcytosine-specific restriction enzyme A